jgi:hypothetical protein
VASHSQPDGKRLSANPVGPYAELAEARIAYAEELAAKGYAVLVPDLASQERGPGQPTLF